MPRETLTQKVARMDEENARLRAELEAAQGERDEARTALDDVTFERDAAREELDARVAAEAIAPPPAPPAAPAGTRRGTGVGRAFASVVFILIASLLAPVALVANTGYRLLTDTQFFVDTLQPIIDDADVQSYVIDTVTDTIVEQVDVDSLVADLFAGLDGLGLPPRATAALQLLQGPATDGVHTLIERAVTEVVHSDQFSDVIGSALRLSHEQVIAALSGQGEVLQISATGEVGIAMGPIVERVKQYLLDAGFGLASAIPEVDAVIVVAQSNQLAQLVWIYQLAVAVGPWLQWVALALFAVGVLFARRKANGLIGAGIGLAAGAGVLAAGVGAGRYFGLSAVSGTVPAEAFNAIYDALVASITAAALAAVIVGLAVVLVAYLAGPYRSSTSLRAFAESGADSLRAAGEEHGVSTGRFGEYVFRARLAIRVAVALVAAAIILFVRPLTPAIIIWTLVIALLVVAVARILERPPVAEVSDADAIADPEIDADADTDAEVAAEAEPEAQTVG